MFHRRPGISVASAAGLAAAVVVAAPSRADTCAESTTCPTTVTFTVTAEGGLAVTLPTSAVNLGTGNSGGHISAQLGAITVSDQRAALNATWTATVVAGSGGFTTGAGTSPETIPNDEVYYWSGQATATTGTGNFVAGQPTAADDQTLDTTRISYSKTSGSGDNSCTWNPTLEIHVPDDAVAGTYTGTVHHSVT
ncbi:hypothetical protein [Nonomuraea sp. B19D2]|uniref:hypothetical protein n=1 Tax=Nonomuraea sp. B19D2 TaxID=3159561 RepID=UPI0032D9F8B8